MAPAPTAGGVVRGAFVTTIGQWTRLVVQISSVALLARLLAPEHFGLVAMVLAVTGFADQLKDLGLTAATVQRRDLTRVQLSGMFWLNAGLGVALGVVVATAGPALAAFYDEPQLSSLTLALAVTFPLSGLAVQHVAMLQRAMRFKALVIVETGSLAIGVAAAAVAALRGAGVWSLVVLYVGSAAARCALAWAADPWIPARPRRHADLRGLLGFGGAVSGFNLLNYLSRSADNILIGRFWGADALGVYSRAYALLLMPLQQLNAPMAHVALPVLSRLREDGPRYRDFYRTALGVLCLVGLPGVGLVVVLADEVIEIFLGPGWQGAVPIFRWLAVAGLLQLVANTNGWLYMSCGTTSRMLRWAMVSRPLVLLSFVAGLPWGPVGVAAAYATVQLLLTPFALVNATRGTPVSTWDTVRGVMLPACLGVVSVTAAVTTRTLVGDQPSLVTCLVVGLVAALVHTLLVVLIPAARKPVQRILRLRKAA